MPLEVDEVINACHVIATQENLDVCITESFKGAAVAGACAFVSGLLMGPVGVAVGGTIGGFAGSALCKSYKPLPQIIQEMSAQDKQRLYDHMIRAVQALEITDAVLLLAIVSNPAHLGRATLARELQNFFGAAIAPAARQQIPQ